MKIFVRMDRIKQVAPAELTAVVCCDNYKQNSVRKVSLALVSHMANKKMKKQLHMASLTGIKFDEGLKQYYDRKVSSGRNKMSVLNAVRNKLVARVFAVVN